MKRKKDDPRRFLNQPSELLNAADTISAQECTGIGYIPPQNEAELEAMKELHNLSLPKEK